MTEVFETIKKNKNSFYKDSEKRNKHISILSEENFSEAWDMFQDLLEICLQNQIFNMRYINKTVFDNYYKHISKREDRILTDEQELLKMIQNNGAYFPIFLRPSNSGRMGFGNCSHCNTYIETLAKSNFLFSILIYDKPKSINTLLKQEIIVKLPLVFFNQFFNHLNEDIVNISSTYVELKVRNEEVLFLILETLEKDLMILSFSNLNLLKTIKRNCCSIRTIVAELAGADSLAAIVKYLKEHPNDEIIPTWIITPNEQRSNFDLVLNNYNLFINSLREQNYRIKNLILLENNQQLWSSLMKINFKTPCIACHLYCHLLRASLAQKYNKLILTGERKSHNGKIKWNQNEIVLENFNNFFNKHNLFFIKPLEEIENTEDIEKLLIDIDFDVKNKNNFITCSAQKIPLDLTNSKEVEQILDYLNKKVIPMVEASQYV